MQKSIKWRLFLLVLLGINYLTLKAQNVLFLPYIADSSLIVTHNYYTLYYSETDEQPYWVAYMLTSDMVKNNVCKRGDDFRVDPIIPNGSATLSDYKGSGYDRGHLCPAGDMAFNCEAMSESFFMSNMSPQKPDFNRGIWKRLESAFRKEALKEDTVFVVTGPVLNQACLGHIGENCVSVPSFYYKVMYYKEKEKWTSKCYLLPHEGSKMDLNTFEMSIDSLENFTEIDFYPYNTVEDGQ